MARRRVDLLHALDGTPGVARIAEFTLRRCQAIPQSAGLNSATKTFWRRGNVNVDALHVCLSGNQVFRRLDLKLAIVQKFSVDVGLFDRYFSDKVWVDARRVVT